jgi:hypothetical protein
MSSSESKSESSDSDKKEEEEGKEEEEEIEEVEFKGKIAYKLEGNSNFANGCCETKDGEIVTANESDGNVYYWSKKGKLGKLLSTTGKSKILYFF